MAKARMGEVTAKSSKEFQIKLRQEVGEQHSDARGQLLALLKSIQAQGRYDFKITNTGKKKAWKRHGERYDTLPDSGLFRANGISLASEKRKGADGGTKLKCKLHNLVPELLYDKPKKSCCWPRNKIKGIKRKFKLEQDVHFNNTKYCATGYMTLAGNDHQFRRVKDFRKYFPLLLDLPEVRNKLRLVKVKDWDEFVHDDMEFNISGVPVKGALVTRRNRRDGSWDETEFSFKLKQDGPDCDWLWPGAGWDYRCLENLAGVYRELFEVSSVFIQSPSIFYFNDPVSSEDIILP